MTKIRKDSIAIGICLGTGLGIVLGEYILGIAIGSAIGATGIFNTERKNKKSRSFKKEE